MSTVPKVQMAPKGPVFSSLVQGYWRLAEWNMSPQQRLSFIKEHVALGVTTIDHAHIYGRPSCEQLFGEALAIDPILRDKIEIISKCGISLADSGKVAHYNSSKESILSSVEKSLKRLGTEYLDVLLIHRPDFLMDADEIAEAFSKLKQEGMVNHFGVSNFTSAQLSLLQSRLEVPLVTNQIEINPINLDVFESGLLEDLQRVRMRPMAWSCLGGGEIFSEKSEDMEGLRNKLHELVGELGAKSIDQVIYAWVMRAPANPLPILGSGNIDRVRAAVESLELNINNEQWYRVWSASKGHDVP
ncbi:MAG: aldo/keto reductase [Arenicella sp.]|jgi:predicted oxidoreductase|nr:aldo/keto reductase [Arenicella sp.]